MKNKNLLIFFIILLVISFSIFIIKYINDTKNEYQVISENMLFQQLKQGLIQNNTMGGDAMSMTELFMSDDFMELKEAARRAREYVQKSTKQQQKHEAQMIQAKQQLEAQKHKDTVDLGYAKIEGDIQESKINALGRASDKQADQNSFDVIQKAAEILGCSRPHLIKLLENGEIEYTKVGKHRRIMFEDIITYRQKMKEQQKKHLIDIMSFDEESGLYDS